MRTARLRLRRWRFEDRAAFAALNADPDVMRFMPRCLTPRESDAWMDRIAHEFERDGFGLWALERLDRAGLIGFTGLNRVPFDASFTPAVEIGWRLARRCWGQGYATEAAHAAAEAGFDRYGLGEIVAETTETNLPSRRVMQRLGMRHDAASSFDHPAYALDDPLSRHVLYRLAPRRRVPAV